MAAQLAARRTIARLSSPERCGLGLVDKISYVTPAPRSLARAAGSSPSGVAGSPFMEMVPPAKITWTSGMGHHDVGKSLHRNVATRKDDPDLLVAPDRCALEDHSG